MKNFLSLLIAIISLSGILQAQTKSAMPMPDVKRLMAMSPAEREKYTDSLKKAMTGQVEKMASDYGIAIDETVLPGNDITPPVKDIARLALIPSRPPTRTELVQQVQKSREQLSSVVPKPTLAEVEKFSAQQSLATIHNASIANFYNNDPEKALLLMMKVAVRQPDSILVLNNLAAMYNMAGLPHRAVPLLQYCLQQEPGSSVVLNNIAQSYMGLGELVKARFYFLECLALDSLNPDANRSMGLLHMYEKKFDDAMRCFERELMVAMRSSTIAYAAKMGKKFNLRALKAKRDALNKRPQKDFFEEINLGKFKIPSYPETVAGAYEQVPEFKEMATSVGQEIMFWLSISNPSAKQIEADGKAYHGIYSSLVSALLDELNEEFTPNYLANHDDNDLQNSLDILSKYEKLLKDLKCPQAPPGSSFEAQQAFEYKCCIQQQLIISARIAEYGGYWYGKMKIAQQRWKSYLNQMIAIVQLDPSLANQMMVYRAVSAYFTFLSQAMRYSGTAQAASYDLLQCKGMNSIADADSVIKADRDWRLQCPSWLNIEVDVEVAKIKADCSKYGIEVGTGLIGQYEYDFKTGSSTLAAGMGVKAKFFAGIGKASIKQLVYVTFDNNNQFSDFGLRTKAEVGIGDTPINIGPVKVGGTIAGIEGNTQISINTGFTSNVKGKGVLADFIKIDKSL
ncbi:MAG: hypothetical protein WCF67_05925 [Chitinophagaceae bacterium]